MSLQTPRLPLDEFSSSRLNNIALVGGNHFLKNSSSSTTTLPSIKSLMNDTSIDVHPVQISIRPEPLLLRSHTTIPTEPVKNYNEISKKLQVRLQFAYYKYKTKQTDLKFADIKRKRIDKNRNKNKNNNNKTKTKSKRTIKNVQGAFSMKRNLVLSHGSYKTPLKRTTTQPFLKNIHETFSEATSSSHSKSYNTCVDSSVASTITNHSHQLHNDTTVINLTTTPIRNQKLALFPKQETPMSVKAAKSLIHLFTSSNHF